MSYDQYESSRALGQPINLIHIRFGSSSSAYLAYTDSETPVFDPANGITYQPIPVQRGNITSSGALDKAQVEIRTPHDSALADLFKIHPPSKPVTMTIRQGHKNDPASEFLVVWVGRILSCGKEASEAIFRAEPISTTMKRPGLRRNYQYGCPHVLYGTECRASQNAATRNAVVASLHNNSYTVTLRDNWEGSSGNFRHYVGGMMTWTDNDGDDKRTIQAISSDGNRLRLNGPTYGLTVGHSVKVIKGCNHTMTHCQDVHDNIKNFGGFPWIPLKNPLGLVNNYY